MNSTFMDRAHRMRSAANNMQKEIDHKFNPPLARQSLTRRRLRILEHMRDEGEAMQRVQFLLRRLAEMYESGNVPEELSSLTHKAAIQAAYYNRFDPLMRLLEERVAQENPTPQQIQDAERKVFGVKIPGFFPTPPNLIEHMVSFCPNLQPNSSCLDPEGGKGDICDYLKSRLAEWNLVETCEVNYTLREILLLKGHVLVGDDFLQYIPEKRYNVIVMNPPFEDGQDIKHIRHAYDHCLAPGGSLVALAGPSYQFRREKKYEEFRSWLSDKRIYEETVKDGFKKGFRSTGVAVQLLAFN